MQRFGLYLKVDGYYIIDRLSAIGFFAKTQEMVEFFPYYPEMPANIETRLKQWHHKQSPSLWKRLTFLF